MRDEDRQNENNIKVLFFILTRIDGRSKRIDMNREVMYENRTERQHDHRSIAEG
jgi:hypothetical protein